MQELIKVLLSTLIVIGIGYPVVCLFDKWKKEMERQEK